MQRVLLIFGAGAWFVVLFLITFVLSFPSDAIVERVRWEVSERSRDEYAITIDSLSPWWVGASAGGVKLYQAPRRGAEKELAFMASDLRASVSPLSLLSRAPRVRGSVTPIDGTLAFDVSTGRIGKREELGVTGVNLQATSFPIGEMMLLGGLDGSGIGGLDIDVDLQGPEGMRTGSGQIVVSGANLALVDLAIPGVGPLGMELPLDEVSLNLKVDEGEAEVVRGDIRSPLLTAAISGTVRLRDDLARSNLDIEILISNLGNELSMFEPFLTQGDLGGGKYQISCPGTLGDPRCALGKGRASSSRGSSRSVRPTTPRSRPTMPVRSSTGSSGSTDADRPDRLDPEELKRRREERLERLRALREQRTNRDDAEEPVEDDLPPDDEGEYYDDEEVFDDEEEFLDEEPFDEEEF